MPVERNDAPAWQEPAGDEPDTAARPVLATLSKRGLVKLKLVPYEEATRVVLGITQEVGAFVGSSQHLKPTTAESWASLALLHDIWEYQLAPHERRPPDTVSLVLSRCEALMLWKLWQYMPLPAYQVPQWAQVMEAIQQLLGQ